MLLAAGLAACGGSSNDSSGSTAAEAAGTTEAEGGSSKQGEAMKGKEGKKSSNSKSSGSGSSAEGADGFTPKQHNDSGGGSGQYKVKGGDNSVQEFGKEAGVSERDEAAAALHNFLDARAEGNWGAACSYMAKSIVESFEKLAAQAKEVQATDCAGIIEKLTNPAAKASMKAEAKQADVGSLRVEGDRSFIIYTGTEGTVLAMPMTNEGSNWKVGSLAGTPLN